MKLWQATRWKVRKVKCYAGVATTVGRVGARFYGLVWHRYPLLAVFADDSWYNPAITFGLAVGPLEIGCCLLIRSFDQRDAEASEVVLPESARRVDVSKETPDV